VRLPGSAFTCCRKAASVGAFIDGPTTSTVGLTATVQIGEKERTASNFTRAL